ncbi:MAG: hypothetical protein ACJAVV_003434 [Alphaproteobacteria bacterium]|jgi:hypothetical protein
MTAIYLNCRKLGHIALCDLIHSMRYILAIDELTSKNSWTLTYRKMVAGLLKAKKRTSWH